MTNDQSEHYSWDGVCEKAENPIKGRIYIDETSDTDRVEHYKDFINAEHDYSYDEDPANNREWGD